MDASAEYAHNDVEEEEDTQKLPDDAVLCRIKSERDGLRVEERKDQHRRGQQRLKFYQHLPGTRQALVIFAHEGGGQSSDANTAETGY